MVPRNLIFLCFLVPSVYSTFPCAQYGADLYGEINCLRRLLNQCTSEKQNRGIYFISILLKVKISIRMSFTIRSWGFDRTFILIYLRYLLKKPKFSLRNPHRAYRSSSYDNYHYNDHNSSSHHYHHYLDYHIHYHSRSGDWEVGRCRDRGKDTRYSVGLDEECGSSIAWSLFTLTCDILHPPEYVWVVFPYPHHILWLFSPQRWANDAQQ